MALYRKRAVVIGVMLFLSAVFLAGCSQQFESRSEGLPSGSQLQPGFYYINAKAGAGPGHYAMILYRNPTTVNDFPARGTVEFESGLRFHLVPKACFGAGMWGTGPNLFEVFEAVIGAGGNSRCLRTP